MRNGFECMRRSAAGLALGLLPVLKGRPATAQAADAAEVASGTRYQLIGTYDTARLDRILGTELDSFMSSSPMATDFRGRFPAARHTVRLYRVTYPSVIPDLANRPTTASGLVAVPETGQASMPMVSYQHGTVFDRSYVPSNPENSAETRIMLARFAAQGYVVIGADYFGRGESDLPDSYLVKASTQQATYDMQNAARAVLAALGIRPGHFFVSGWSQGGWATMAFLQRLEGVGIPVTAATVASAPVDIALIVNRWLNNPQAVDAVYLPGTVAIHLQACGNYHGMPGLDAEAIRPEYLQAARDLYAGRSSFETFFAATPPKLQDFIRPEFRADVAAGRGRYWRIIDAAEVYRWRRKTPLRTWYGGSDEVTPIAIGRLPEQTQALLGGAETRAFDAGDRADHRAVFLRAVLDQKDWFDSFLSS